MKIRKFFEQYELDLDNGEIGEEYAKMIISKFIDKDADGSTLEQIYKDVVKADNLDEDQAFFVRQDLIIYTKDLLNQAQKIRDIYKIDAETYNL